MSKPSGILTLDLASRLGFCIWNPGTRPTIGTYKLPEVARGSYGKRNSFFRQWLIKAIEKNNITTCIYEDNLCLPTDTVHKLKLLYSLTMITEEACFDLGVQCASVGVGQWRKHYLGAGNYPTDQAKEYAMKKARNSGFEPKHHDAAEALGIMDYAADHFRIKRDWKNANFFGGI